MRIGMFCDMYLPHVSGVTNHIRLYKAELERQGHHVTIFTYGNRDYVDAEPDVVRSPGIAWGSTGWNWPLPITAQAKAAMRDLDIAHTHHPFSSCLTALSQCGSRGIPVIFTSHTRYDLYSDTYVRFLPQAVRHTAIRKFLAAIDRRVTLTISPSAQVAEWLTEVGMTPDKLLVFPNAIDTRPFAQPATRTPRNDLGFAEDDFVLAYVGRIANEKNVDLLLESFARAHTRAPRLALVLMGDGPTRSRAERFVADKGLTGRVRFCGMTAYENVPGILASCDAFTTASVSEIYPLVVVEACATGLPVIGVRSPGVSEIVTHDASGLLTAEDADELASAMARLASDPSLASRLAEGARAVAAAHDIGPSTSRLIDQYERLLAHGARHASPSAG